MDNVLTLNKNNNVLTQEEIETLFKGFIKLVEKNTEQRLKNSLALKNLNAQNGDGLGFKSNSSLPKLKLSTVKDLEQLKKTALKIYDENKRLKKELCKLETKVLELRSEIISQKNKWD